MTHGPGAPAAPVDHVLRAKPPGRFARFLDRLLGPLLAPVLLFGALGALLASRMMMPGVTVLTGTRPGASALTRAPGATYFVTGITERGDTAEPVLVRSMAEYVEKLGDRVTYGYLFDDLEQFFGEGGERAYVMRIVGDTPTTGLLTLVDRAGAPVNTVRVNAKNAGAWSTRVTVQVTDGAIANTFRVFVFYDGILVEQYLELATPAAMVTAINASSNYLTATDLASATVAPANNPAVLAATALSAGTDDRGTIVSGDYTAALASFGPELAAGAVAIPGQGAATVGAGLIAHAKAFRRIAILAPPIASTTASRKTIANGLRSTSGSEFAGLFGPWVKVSDGAGGTRTIPPEGYVAGVRARTIRVTGAWRAPAGQIAIARHVVGLESDESLTRAELDDLATSRVNTIVVKAGAVRNYGWRSLSLDESVLELLMARDLMNVLAMLGEAALEQFVFRPVDGRGILFGEVEAELRAILEPIRAAGGLYERLDPETGAVIDPGYLIDTGPGVNTPEVLGNNEVRANVSIRVSPAAELITLSIVAVGFDVALAAQ